MGPAEAHKSSSLSGMPSALDTCKGKVIQERKMLRCLAHFLSRFGAEVTIGESGEEYFHILGDEESGVVKVHSLMPKTWLQ